MSFRFELRWSFCVHRSAFIVLLVSTTLHDDALCIFAPRQSSQRAAYLVAADPCIFAPRSSLRVCSTPSPTSRLPPCSFLASLLPYFPSPVDLR